MRAETKRGVRVALLVALLSLGVLEVALRLVYPLADPFPNQRAVEIGAYVPYRHAPGFELEIVPEEGLPGVSGPRRFETNADGYLGPNLADTATSAARVFLVGGSTMECVALGNGLNPATLLQDDLRSLGFDAAVLNTGHSGDATFDHLAVLVHRIVHQKPRAVVFLVGVNDLVAIGRGERYDHAHPDQTVPLDGPGLARLALTRLYVGRLLWAALGKARLRQWDEDAPRMTTHYARAAARCAEQPAATTPPRVDIEGFERNLRALVAATKSLGAIPVLATQPHSWRSTAASDRFWMNCFGGVRYAPEDMAKTLDRFNRVTLRVAAETGAIAVDLAARLNGGPEYMYDDVHFNDAGARAVAGAFADALRPHL